MRTHESLADNRLRFAAKLSEMSDELMTLSKEVDRNRKQARETGLRLERNLQDAEAGVEKVRLMPSTIVRPELTPSTGTIAFRFDCRRSGALALAQERRVRKGRRAAGWYKRRHEREADARQGDWQERPAL